MSNNAHNRPLRPGHMLNSNMGQGTAWVPGLSMPPLGFGVVPQQPGSMMMAPAQVIAQPALHQGAHLTNWHQQQFVAGKMAVSSAPVGVQPLTQQQQQQQQYQQHLQQQQFQQHHWLEVQKKAAEEQKKLYEQMMKQRQFDEQKMRLRAFSSTKKAGVSADSMIENILGSKETSKMRSPQVLKFPVAEALMNQAAALGKQSTAVDWSKMENVNTLFASHQNRGTVGQASQPGALTLDTTSDTAHPVTAMDPANQMSMGRPDGFTGGHVGLSTGFLGNPVTNVGSIGNNDNKASLLEGGSNEVIGKNVGGKVLPLPSWLSDKNSLPSVYKQAVSLVEGKEGWVDTSRAYMLLMKTGLPPPFLGVLWEMVNCTQPGQLLDSEFTTLLALVALVQSGHTITSREVLSTVKEPVLPIIDHPALLPLVQDYIRQRQQQNQQSAPETIQESGTAAVAPSLGSQQLPSVSNDDDDFDDFVSGPSQVVKGNSLQSTQAINPLAQGVAGHVHPPVKLAPPTVLPPGAGGLTPLNQKPLIPSVDKIKKMNLPKVGFSPELSPSTSFDHTCDDEFDDFQSAGAPGMSSASIAGVHASQPAVPVPNGQNVGPPVAAESSQAIPTLLQPEKSDRSGDKYAVFRELEAQSEGVSGPDLSQPLSHDNVTVSSADEGFGEFCSSEPVSLTGGSTSFPPIPSVSSAGPGTNNTSPVSFEVYSTPPEMISETNTDNYFEADFSGAFTSASTQSLDNYADIHEAMKRVEVEQKKEEATDWSDPFGESEEAPSIPIARTSVSSGSLPAPQVGIGEEEDEDFGDFMGHDTGIAEPVGLSINQSFPSLTENLGETQSVASLELPGLEMTVGLQSNDTHGSGLNQSPDLFMQSRNEIGAVEDHLRSLSLESSTAFGEVSGNGSSLITNGTAAGSVSQTSGTSSVLDSFSSGLVDKYSIIREEASKNTHDEAHTGSWQRCLECSIRVLKQARDILSSLDQSQLKTQVLATSQMQDYLANLVEVWYVCRRISSSSQQVTTSAKVDDLLSQAKSLWEEISAAGGNSITKEETPEGDNQMEESEVCGVCLAGGGSKLTYGGHSYHPPCANLWLNCVDLLLPSLTPVTLL
ncbi:uncharacterized protein [Panulirus ornatus]|uniref:uncharacterized protein isoform X2 n=1 Tax=Panulirus ornatus TaxID=150431 RepID=UPI003A84ED58